MSEQLKPNNGKSAEPVGAVLVCGAGIAGIQSSLDLANSGFKVYLLETSAAIGGRMAQLDKTFPTGDCAMCTLSPKLVEAARNKNVEIITLADIQKVSGEPGNFQVEIRKRPRYVDPKKCNACGECSIACPVSLPSEFDRELGTRKAIFRPYPQAIPNVFGISKAVGRAPCKASCPAGVNVQGYVALLAQGKVKEAYDVVRERCPLPAVCGRVCQHPCETKCNRNDIDEPVAARDLKRFAADYVYAHRAEIKDVPSTPQMQQKERIAVVGGGPAGLTAATDLRSKGYGVTIFDAMPLLGGMLRYGIPRYRLPGDVLDHEIQYILDMGIEARTSTRVADPTQLLKTARDCRQAQAGEFDAVFVATGAWVSRKLGVPGEDSKEVWPGLTFLREVNAGRKPAIGPKVLVIGGGDVAMDAARCARRLPGVTSVDLACLEKREEMPAHSWEANEALEEGVVFHPSLGPTKIVAQNGKVSGVSFRACTRVFDDNRRFAPTFDDAQVTNLDADTVIVTIGQGIEVMAPLTAGPGGRIVSDRDTLATSVPGVFAGGDAVLGPASLVDAMAQGHRAATTIDSFLRGTLAEKGAAVETKTEELAPTPETDAPPVERRKMKQASPEERVRGFGEIDVGYTYEDAMAEAKRCLACGLCSECGQCVKACSAGAIVHDMQPVTETLNVGAILLTPGFEEFDPALRGEFGHGRYSNVMSNVQFERLLSAAGPTSGDVLRPSDGKHPKRIAFIQCVGSRDTARGNGYCSSICCMAAAKEAMVAIEHVPGLDVSVFCMDVRAFGKEFDQYVNRARDEQKVKFIRAIPSRLVEMPDTHNLRVRYFDDNGEEQKPEFDLVVLSAGLRPNAGVKELAQRLGLELDQFGFCRTDRMTPVTSSRPGIFVAGAFQEPKDIPESVAQATGAAALAMESLAAVRGNLIQRQEYPWERDVTDEKPRVGVFICHCGHNIASVVDVAQVAERAGKMPNVAHAEASLYTCSDTNQQHIKDMIREHKLNRLVVASCSPRTHEILFQETLRDSSSQSLPVRDDQHPRSVFLGPSRRSRGCHGQGHGSHAHGRGPRPQVEGAGNRAESGHPDGAGVGRWPGWHDRGAGTGGPGLSRSLDRERGGAGRPVAQDPLHAGALGCGRLPDRAGSQGRRASQDHRAPEHPPGEDHRTRGQVPHHGRRGGQSEDAGSRRGGAGHRRPRARHGFVPAWQTSGRAHPAPTGRQAGPGRFAPGTRAPGGDDPVRGQPQREESLLQPRVLFRGSKERPGIEATEAQCARRRTLPRYSHLRFPRGLLSEGARGWRAVCALPRGPGSASQRCGRLAGQGHRRGHWPRIEPQT